MTLAAVRGEIGGDFIEAFFLDDGSLIATVADATGHGIFASLFTIVFKMLLHSAVGRSRKLHLQSFMLGIEEDTREEEIGFSLEPGEIFFLASDGLFESECDDGKAFGVPGVQRFFAHRQGEQPLEELMAEVRGAGKFTRLPDDVSILSIMSE